MTLESENNTTNGTNTINGNCSKKTAMEIFNESIGKFVQMEPEREQGVRAAISCDIHNYRKHVSKFNSTNKPDIKSAQIFWETYGHTFTVLQNVAKKLLSVPATSVPSESCFSVASFLSRKERSRLTGENLSSSVFLKDKIIF